MAKRKNKVKSPLDRLVAAYCDRYPGNIDELAEMLQEERIDFVAEFCIQMLRNAQFVVKYRAGNDKSGKYRWWTRSMELVGQFEHASDMADLMEKAKHECSCADVTLVDADEETP